MRSSSSVLHTIASAPVNTLESGCAAPCFDEVHLGFKAGPDGDGAVVRGWALFELRRL